MMRNDPRQLIANPEIEIDEQIGTIEDVGDDDLWKVIIHNDDDTPMQFVIFVLVEIFKRPLIFAEGIMWEAHNNGMAVICSLPKNEAETKVRQAHFRARISGYPLKLTIEPADS